MTDEIKQVVAEAPEFKESLDNAIARMASLPPRQYQLCRRNAAKQFGVQLTFLDDEVAAARKGDDNQEAENLGLFDPEPSEYPVDGDDLFDRIVREIRRYMVMPPHSAEATALWVAHAHVFQLWQQTPRLSISAPTMGSGKSTLLDVISCLVPRALKTENLSTAVLFRAVEKYRPTLLVDEVDTFLRDNEELRGCLNAGHAKGAKHLRCEGDNHEIKSFSTFAPAALAGIGNLPGTLEDRAVSIVLQRRKPDEYIQDFRADRAAALYNIASEIARWVEDNMPALECAEPVMPPGIHNRRADNWRPLLAIADTAGGEWPKRARAAALALSGKNDEAASYNEQVLADIRDVFNYRDADRIESKVLVDALIQMDERPWAEFRRGKPISSRQLSSLLKPFGITSGSIRFDDGHTAKGYYQKDFEVAFSRYLPSISVTTSQSMENCEELDVPIRQKDNAVTDRNGSKVAESRDCDVVTDKIPPLPEKQGTTVENANSGDDDLEERAAIIEFDGGRSQLEAKAFAGTPTVSHPPMPDIPPFLDRRKRDT